MGHRSPRTSDVRARPPRPRARRGASLVVALGCLGALACKHAAPLLPAAPGSVRGRVVANAGAPDPAREPMLVYLEPLDRPQPGDPRRAPPILRATKRGLEPLVLAVGAGHSIRFQNDAGIFHHLFSYSESNPFNLGVLRRGEAKSIELRKPGVVRIYCTLHPAEAAILLVAPSDYFAVSQTSKTWEILDVPPGRYRLGAWGETSSAQVRTITVGAGASVVTEIATRRLATLE
jgi:hypothetical protein